MKVVFCGPPHSGKSVFISNIINKLPSNSYSVVRATPDGEGMWSNNENQYETSIVRKKRKLPPITVEKEVKYQKEGQDYWSTSEDLSFFLAEGGIYKIKIINGNVESEEKTISITSIDIL